MSALADTREKRLEGKKLTADDRARRAEARDRLDAASFTLAREGDEAMARAHAAVEPRDFRRFALLACSRYAQAAMTASQAKSYQDDLDRGWAA